MGFSDDMPTGSIDTDAIVTAILSSLEGHFFPGCELGKGRFIPQDPPRKGVEGLRYNNIRCKTNNSLQESKYFVNVLSLVCCQQEEHGRTLEELLDPLRTRTNFHCSTTSLACIGDMDIM